MGMNGTPPTPGWKRWLPIMLGLPVGLGIYTFVYARGHSYLSDDPTACANCHIMQDHLDSWRHSSHHAVATCNDCHTPHGTVAKWVSKADNGFFHSLAFTTGEYPDPLRAKPRNRRITQNACIECHRDTVHVMLPGETGGDMLDCVRCHTSVGHAHRPRGLDTQGAHHEP